jgi:flagellar protein FliS
MFSAAHPAQAYRRIGVETDVASATPHRLVHLLYEGALAALRAARCHLAAGRIADKGLAISRALRILDEGLKASVDATTGDPLGARLAALYDYMGRRLVVAGRENDDRGLAEVERLLESLHEAWRAIEPVAARDLPSHSRRAVAA